MNAAPSSVPAVTFSRRMDRLRPSAIREILKTTESPEIISFAGGLPAPELFPSDVMAEAAAAVLSRDARGALQYGVTEGFSPLREWVSAHLKEEVALSVPPSRILITHGSQQGLDLLSKVLLDPGDVVLVESPAYLGALQAFQSYEAEIVGLPSDSCGLQVDALEAYLRSASVSAKFLYLIPNYQNPTGTSLSVERRSQLAKVAQAYGLLIVEDDPYGRLRYSGPTLPAVAASAESAEWVYLGSTSKILAPGLRVAWLATSHAGLFERLVTAKQACDLHTGSFTQRLVHEVVQQPGFLARHVELLKGVYRSRRDVMLAELSRHFPQGTAWTRPDGGLFLWVETPRGSDTIELLPRAMAEKVAFVPGAPFWVGNEVSTTLRLNFSNATEDRIREGIARLSRVLSASL